MIFTIIASAASIIGVPLSIFLFWKGEVKKKEKREKEAREKINQIILLDISKGNTLSPFEINSLLESTLREYKLKSNVISFEEVVNDLIASIKTNSFIKIEDKKEIIRNCKILSISNQVQNILTAVDYQYSKLNSKVDQQKIIHFKEGLKQINASELSAEDERKFAVIRDENIRFSNKQKDKEKSMINLFGIISLALSVLSLGIFLIVYDKIFRQVIFDNIDTKIGVSILLGFLVSLLTFLIVKGFLRPKKKYYYIEDAEFTEIIENDINEKKSVSDNENVNSDTPGF